MFSLLHRARNEDFEFPSPNQEVHLSGISGAATRDDVSYTRDPSPELVRISPLVTRPPKQKPSSKYHSELPSYEFEEIGKNNMRSASIYQPPSVAGDYQSSYYHQPQYQQQQPIVQNQYLSQNPMQYDQYGSYNMDSYNQSSSYGYQQHQSMHHQQYYQPASPPQQLFHQQTHHHHIDPYQSHAQQQQLSIPQQHVTQQTQSTSYQAPTTQSWNISQNKSSYIVSRTKRIKDRPLLTPRILPRTNTTTHSSSYV